MESEKAVCLYNHFNIDYIQKEYSLFFILLIYIYTKYTYIHSIHIWWDIPVHIHSIHIILAPEKGF